MHQKLPLEVGMDISVITRAGAKPFQRFASGYCTLAFAQKTDICHQIQRHAMVLWDEVFEEVSANYPDVQTRRMLVDAMAARFVTDPESIDTVAVTNHHADALSDLATVLSGSLCLAPTGNINPERKTPSMFEPIHGSAFDITGHGVANPLGVIRSVMLMLDHLGESEAAAQLLATIETVTSQGNTLPRDLGGQSGTDEVTKVVCNAL